MARRSREEAAKAKARLELCLRFQEGALFVSGVPFTFPEVADEAQAAYAALVKLAQAVAREQPRIRASHGPTHPVIAPPPNQEARSDE